MTLLLRAAGAGLAGIMMILLITPAAHANNRFLGLDFGQSDLLDDVGDFWAEVTEGLQIKLGVGVSVAPRYEGDNSYKARVLPRFALRYKDLIALNNTRLRVFVVHNETFVTGVQARYVFGRYERASPDLAGLGNVGDSLEMGGFAEWRPGWAVVGLEFGQDVAGGHHGFVANLYMGSELPLGGGWALHGGAQVTWASDHYMQRNFGVTPAQSAASGLPVFDAESGLEQAAVRVGVRFAKWRHWRFDTYVAYARLLADAAHNPLVETRGSPNQFTWAISGEYRF